jgi:hypothetical protein
MMVRGHDVRSLHAAMLQLMDGEVRDRMGASARQYAVANRVDGPFTAVLDSDAYRRQLRKKRKKSEQREDTVKRAEQESGNTLLVSDGGELSRRAANEDANSSSGSAFIQSVEVG